MDWKKVALLIAVLASCANNPPAVLIDAKPADIERLAGRWKGSYEGGHQGRRGIIEFVLQAGEDHAHGEVVMIASGATEAYRPWRETAPAQGSDLELLKIRFVAIEDGAVSGQLEPYRDPACDCRADTRFRGVRQGSVIEGTFVTYAAVGGPTYGKWRVRRQPP